MKCKGYVGKIEHIVLSDPSYDNNVWCRYENNNIEGNNWIALLDVIPTEEEINGIHITGIDFGLLLYNGDSDSFKKLKDFETKKYELGVDTACIALGVNEYAKKILDSQDEWQPDCSLITGADGIFGEVVEGKRNGKLEFLNIHGYVSDEFCEDDIATYLIRQFKITNIIYYDKENFDNSLEI